MSGRAGGRQRFIKILSKNKIIRKIILIITYPILNFNKSLKDQQKFILKVLFLAMLTLITNYSFNMLLNVAPPSLILLVLLIFSALYCNIFLIFMILQRSFSMSKQYVLLNKNSNQENFIYFIVYNFLVILLSCLIIIRTNNNMLFFMNFMTNNSGLGKIILIVIIATIILLTLLFSMVYEALFSVKFRKCYFDNDVNTINLNLTFFKLFMLAVSLSFIMFALYSLANTIYSTYSEISENVTKEIVRSSRFNMFGSGSATEILNNNVKQVNVNIQCDSGSAIVEDSTLPHRLVNKMYQENTNTQTGAKDNIAMQKNVNTQQASSSKSPVPDNSSQTTLIINDHLGTNTSTSRAPPPLQCYFFKSERDVS